MIVTSHDPPLRRPSSYVQESDTDRRVRLKLKRLPSMEESSCKLVVVGMTDPGLDFGLDSNHTVVPFQVVDFQTIDR